MKTIIRKEQESYEIKLTCPITGSPLRYIGTERDVMDPDQWYSPESDKSIIFARHPFCWNLFRQVTEKRTCARELRIFKLNEDNSWTEMKEVPHGNDLFPMNTPEDDPEWVEACRKAKSNHEEYLNEVKYWNEHPEEDPRVHSHMIGIEQVEVCPLPPPMGVLMYTDFKYPNTKPVPKSFTGGFIVNIANLIKKVKFKNKLKKSERGKNILELYKRQKKFKNM